MKGPRRAFLLWTLCGAVSARAADPEVARQRSEAAAVRQLREALLAPLQRLPDGSLQALPQDLPAEQKQFVLAELAAAPWQHWVSGLATLAGLSPSLAAPGWVLPERTVFGAPDDGLTLRRGLPEGPWPAPDWLLDAVRERLGALLPQGAVPAARLPGWTSGLQGPTDSGIGEAMVWSGPAVKDRAASYRSEAGGTRIRIAALPAAVELLHRWTAVTGGAVMKLSLDDAGQGIDLRERLPLRLDLSLPVWLLTPQELVPATLAALHLGEPCRGGGWLELRVAGERQPPVWAVLFLADAALAATARVRRLSAEAPDPQGGASAVSRLEVAWPDQRLPALTVTAKRFGDIWGTHADLAAPAQPLPQPQPDQHPDQAPPRRLSAAGSPACAPP